MRKLLPIILTLSMLLSLCACGSETDAKEKDTLLSIGDTAEGSSCSVTVTSVEFVDKIENGFLEHMWSPTTRDTYKDVTAEEGYAIVKISYHFDYTGKESGAIPISFVLNYDDGYTFEGGYIFSEGYSTNGAGGHALPAITNTTKIGFEEKYVFGGRTRLVFLAILLILSVITTSPLRQKDKRALSCSLSAFFPLCLSMYRFSFSTPFSNNALVCRSSFCSMVDTLM